MLFFCGWEMIAVDWVDWVDLDSAVDFVERRKMINY